MDDPRLSFPGSASAFRPPADLRLAAAAAALVFESLINAAMAWLAALGRMGSGSANMTLSASGTSPFLMSGLPGSSIFMDLLEAGTEVISFQALPAPSSTLISTPFASFFTIMPF
jgi:hypothetical protein